MAARHSIQIPQAILLRRNKSAAGLQLLAGATLETMVWCFLVAFSKDKDPLRTPFIVGTVIVALVNMAALAGQAHTSYTRYKTEKSKQTQLAMALSYAANNTTARATAGTRLLADAADGHSGTSQYTLPTTLPDAGSFDQRANHTPPTTQSLHLCHPQIRWHTVSSILMLLQAASFITTLFTATRCGFLSTDKTLASPDKNEKAALIGTAILLFAFITATYYAESHFITRTAPRARSHHSSRARSAKTPAPPSTAQQGPTGHQKPGSVETSRTQQVSDKTLPTGTPESTIRTLLPANAANGRFVAAQRAVPMPPMSGASETTPDPSAAPQGGGAEGVPPKRLFY